MRIIALGVLNKPRGTTTVNANARLFLHPPGIEKDEPAEMQDNMGLHGSLASGESGSDTAPMRIGACGFVIRRERSPKVPLT